MRFRIATQVEEVLALLKGLGGEARVIAGGTDVMIQRSTGQLPPSETLVYIGGLDSLRGVEQLNSRIRIGALTTHRELAQDPIVSEYLPSFAEAASTVGGWQTQEAGTIGGNLCNASPAADLAPPVLMTDAVFTLRSLEGERRLAAGEFFLGRRRTARRPDELLVAIEVESPPPATGEVYLKVGRRSATEVALVGLAARLSFSDGVVSDARLALCSVASHPMRVASAEQALVDSTLDAAAIAEAGQLLAAGADPIDDQRASASYRLMIIPRFVKKAVAICRDRAELTL